MRAVLLLGANFLRSQWLPVAVMTAYLAGAGGLFSWHQQASDVQFYLQWHSYNVIFVATLIALPAIWAERRSHRILAVLSKGITRGQYLGGLLCGCVLISGWFCFLIGGITSWLCWRGGIPLRSLPLLMMVVFLCSVTAQSAALLSAVVLHPLLGMIATSVFLLLPLASESAPWHWPAQLFPVTLLISVLREFRFQPLETGIWKIALGAILETFLFWALATALFSRKDVTTSPE